MLIATVFIYLMYERFEDNKGKTRNCKLQTDKQCNNQTKKG